MKYLYIFFLHAYIYSITFVFSFSQNVWLPPSIKSFFDLHKYYRAGDNVTFVCESTGINITKYELWKNKKLIRTETKGEFQLSNLSPNDEGYYQCKVSNLFGTSTTNITYLQMTIFNPFPSNNLKEIIVPNKFSEFFIPCNCPENIPYPLITWRYASDIIIHESNKTQLDEDGKIYFAYVQDFLDKSIHCDCENTFIKAHFQGSYSLLKAQSTENMKFIPKIYTSSASEITGLEREEITLRCLFSGYPLPTIKWFMGDSSQEVNLEDWDLLDSQTKIKSAKPLTKEYEGIYTCNGYNELGNSYYSINLKIEAAPFFSDQSLRPHNINVTENDTVDILCDAHANPATNIKWFKNGIPFDETSLPSKYILSGDSKKLTILNVCKLCPDNTNDLAVIQCNVSNKYGFLYSEGYINVLIATKIESISSNQLWEPNTNISFPCGAKSDESTIVVKQWFFNKEAITSNTDRLFVMDDGTLNIIMDGDEDGGKKRCGLYRCEVSNGFSKDSIEYSLLEKEEQIPSPASLWWISLIILGIILLIILLLFLFCLFCYKKDNETYPVDKNERLNGNIPENDLKGLDFQDYKPGTSISFIPRENYFEQDIHYNPYNLNNPNSYFLTGNNNYNNSSKFQVNNIIDQQNYTLKNSLISLSNRSTNTIKNPSSFHNNRVGLYDEEPYDMKAFDKKELAFYESQI